MDNNPTPTAATNPATPSPPPETPAPGPAETPKSPHPQYVSAFTPEFHRACQRLAFALTQEGGAQPKLVSKEMPEAAEFLRLLRAEAPDWHDEDGAPRL